MSKLIVNEIFRSIDGEVNRWHQGHPSLFIRLAGCNLKCSYCDTEYAQNENSGSSIDVIDLAKEVLKSGMSKITITGGEPLLQYHSLVDFICELTIINDIKISIETNGTIIPPFRYRKSPCISHPFINIVMDYKCPSSNQHERVLQEAFTYLYHDDFIKFVIGTKEDFYFAVDRIKCLQSQECSARMAMSANTKNVSHDVLLGWMFEEKLKNVILNVQLHKLLNLK